VSFIGLLLHWIRSQEPPGNPHTTGYLLLSILGALGATYTLANGNLLWPLLVTAALLLRLRRSALMSLALTGAISTALYSYQMGIRLTQTTTTYGAS